MHRDLRLPLQVGTSSLGGVTRAAAAFAPGVLLACALVFPAVFLPMDEALEAYFQVGLVILFVMFAGFGVLAWGWKHLRLAVRERPSDIVLAADGLRVEGGPNGRLYRAWNQIDPDSVKLVGRHENLELLEEDHVRVNFWELRVDGVVLASAENNQERASLEALCDSIKASAARARSVAVGTTAATGPVTSLHCNNCGAPASPADQEWIQCGYCAGWVRVAEDIRARIRAVLNRDASRRDAERLVEKLIHQPGALRSTLAITLVALPSLGVWLAVVAVAGGLYVLCFLRIFNAALLVLAAFAAIGGFFFLFRGQFTDRQALRLLTLHFSARAPARAGEPHRCRSCNAPLVEPPGSVLVACVYCGEENVLGLDARREAATQSSETASLEETLFKRRDEHRRWRWAAVWALGLLALSAVLVLVSLGPPHDLAAQGNAGDLERLTYDPMNEFSPAPSPDGRLLLYDLRVPEEEHDDAIMASGPEGAFRGTEYVRARQHARRPVWLPDGSGFLYVAEPGNGRATLRHALAPTRFAPVRDVASAGHDIDRPSVSPDSKRVAYAAAETHRGGYYMYVATLDGAQKQRLGPGLNPAWRPDGAAIAYTRTIGGYRHIMLRDPDGNGPIKQLTSGSCHHEDATWSGDGAWIGYIADCGHRGSSHPIWNLFVMRADGSGVQQLTDGTADMEQPVWGGDFVYFSVNVAGNFDIWRVRLGGPLAGHAARPHRS